eukprot:Opistho-2@46646
MAAMASIAMTAAVSLLVFIAFVIYKIVVSAFKPSAPTVRHIKSEPKVKSLNGAENMFLHLEDSERRQTIAGILVFDGPISREAVEKTMSNAVEKHRRLRQVIVGTRIPFISGFKDYHNFKLSDHIVEEFIGSEDEKVLQASIAGKIATPFNKTRPMWEATIFHGIGNSSALFLRMHHAIGDGMSANILLAASALDDAGVSYAEVIKKSFEQMMRGRRRSNSMNTSTAYFNLRSLGVSSRGMILVGALWALSRPISVLMRQYGVLRHFGVSVGQVLVDLFFLIIERKQILAKPSTSGKVASWTTGVSLDEIKAIKSAFGVTVNDVLVSAITGAMRRHIVRLGRRVPRDVFSPIPVMLRRSVAEIETLRNQVAAVWHFLPTGMEDPVARLKEVHERMLARKRNSLYMAFTLGNMSFWGASPRSIARPVFNNFYDKAVSIVTNVSGPQGLLRLEGVPIKDIHIFGLQSTCGGTAISIITYNGRVSVTLLADEDAGKAGCASEVFMMDDFQLEIAALKELAACRH